MAQLSQSERDFIEEYPLNNTLNHFRHILLEAEQSFTSVSTSRHNTASKGPEKPRLYAAAIGRLFHNLEGSETALYLSSRIKSQNLASDLLTLRRRVQKEDFDYSHFRALSRLVIDSASDIDI